MVLARFNQVLERHKAEIGQSQYWRYKGGRLPKLLTWLVERPELAQALAADAVELAAVKGDEGAMKGGNEATINQVV
jgi:hypothetical protein